MIKYLIIFFVMSQAFLAAEVRPELFQMLYEVDNHQPKAPEQITEGFGYQIHLDRPALSHLLEELIAHYTEENIQIFEAEFRLLLKKVKVSAQIQSVKLNGLNLHWTSDDTMDAEVEWEFLIDWPFIGKKLATAVSVTKFKTTMTELENQMTLVIKNELTLLDGWTPKVPDVPLVPTKTINRLFKKIGNWIITHGMESAYKIFSKKINEALHKNFQNFIPTIDGKVQKLEVEDIDSKGHVCYASLTPLVLTLKDLLMFGGNDKITFLGKKLRIQNVLMHKERLSIYIVNH